MLLMNQNSCFSIDCCPHTNPSLLLRKQYLSLRELFQSQRDKHCSRSERGARSSNCQQPLTFPEAQALDAADEGKQFGALLLCLMVCLFHLRCPCE